MKKTLSFSYKLAIVLVMVFIGLMHGTAQGLVDAFFNIGEFYEEGWGVAADEVEALRWYKCAAEAGWSDAADSLRRLEA